MLGTLPAAAKLGHGGAEGVVADAPAGQPLLETALGRHLQGPQTGRLAKNAWPLVSEPLEPFETVSREDGVGRVRSGGCGLESGEAPDMKSMERITDSLIIAAEGASPRGGMLPFGTR